MATYGNLVVKFSADTKQLVRGVESAKGTIGSFVESLGNLKLTTAAVAGGLAAAGLAAAKFAKFGTGLAIEAEKMEFQYSKILGSAEDAAALMQNLGKFASQSTIPREEIFEAARGLMGFGVAADEVAGRMAQLGNISAGTGTSLGYLVDVFGRVQIAGNASMGDIQKLAREQIPIYQELEKIVGLSGDQLETFIQKGGVTAEVFNYAFQSMTLQGGKFYNSLIDYTDTVAGKWQTLKDKLFEFASRLGQLFIPLLKKILDIAIAIADALLTVMDYWDRLQIGWGSSDMLGGAWIKDPSASKPKAGNKGPGWLGEEPFKLPQMSKPFMDKSIIFDKPKQIKIETPTLLGAKMQGSAEALKAIETIRQQKYLKAIAEKQLAEQKETNKHLGGIEHALMGNLIAVASLA